MTNSTPELPLTVKPNSVWGIHIKYLTAVWIIVLIACIAIIIASDAIYGMYILIPLVISALFAIWFTWYRRNNAFTVTKDGYVYLKGGKEMALPLTDLGEMHLRIARTTRYAFLEIYITNKSKDIKWYISTNKFWNRNDLRAIYNATPVEYRDPSEANVTAY